MFKKFLITNNIENEQHFKIKIDLLNNYSFLSDLDDDNFYYSEISNSGIFIYGYIFPRINQEFLVTDLKNLLAEFNKNVSSILNKIKGIFTIVHINNGIINIFNDHLGISKFFFSSKNSNITISNSIELVIKYDNNSELCTQSISEYFLFNYSLNGSTFFKNISYSTPASHLIISQSSVRINKYFDIIKEIRNQDTIVKNVFASKYISDIWLNIISQYFDSRNNKISMTLTAGMDSRIILGTLLKLGNENINSFTFGHSDSYDVQNAKIIAKKTGIKHNHYYPAKSFFDDFNHIAKETYNHGESMVTIYRSHRFDAYSKVSKSFKGIIMGLGGSDLLRGIDYDNLIVSKVVFHLWNNNTLESFFAKAENFKRYSGIVSINKDQILDNRYKYLYLNNPLEYLFKVMVPLHFAQDIILNQKLGIDTYIPFLDIDYLYHISKTNYLSTKKIRNYKSYDIKRRLVGLNFSAKFLNSLNNQLSDISLGKGYTPNDIVKSLPVTIINSYLHRKCNNNSFNVPNFSFDEWYWNYIRTYIKANNFDNTFNKNILLSKLSNMRRCGGEYHFLEYTKMINVHMASLLLNK